MEKKRKNLKIKCDCGSILETRLHEFDNLELEAMVCPKCGFVTLTKEQAEQLATLRRISDLLGRKRKVVRIGNTVGVTFPPILVHQGQEVDIHPLAPNKYILTFQG